MQSCTLESERTSGLAISRMHGVRRSNNTGLGCKREWTHGSTTKGWHSPPAAAATLQYRRRGEIVSQVMAGKGCHAAVVHQLCTCRLQTLRLQPFFGTWTQRGVLRAGALCLTNSNQTKGRSDGVNKTDFCCKSVFIRRVRCTEWHEAVCDYLFSPGISASRHAAAPEHSLAPT